MAGKAARSITSVGLLGVAVLFLVVNMLSGLMFTSIRADLTENRLYTLTEGTRNILGRIQEPITLYLFYSDKASENVPQLRKYATRVRELLQEYVALSKGQVVLNFIDPLPYSEQEDRASAWVCRVYRWEGRVKKYILASQQAMQWERRRPSSFSSLNANSFWNTTSLG